MNVGLFIPCYIDQFYPQTGIAVYQVLRRLGLEVDYPTQQTCCGQPVANAGFADYGGDALRLFAENFARYDFIVAPSGSCVLHVKDHITHYTDSATAEKVRSSLYEFCEFLTDVVNYQGNGFRFPYKVGLHAGCHGVRGLRLNRASELHLPDFNKPRSLLQKVKDLELVELTRPDECCGFGGTFSVTEEAVSIRMGEDRVEDHMSHGAQVIAGTDMSCLMHLEGIIRHRKLDVKVMHIAEILDEAWQLHHQQV
ncbi:MAG TPA: (Fe-S)-binding protein [Cyclobacteriaceae bacterium]|jgi:L-lactate dehydrogenase complex protein LldE